MLPYDIAVDCLRAFLFEQFIKMQFSAIRSRDRCMVLATRRLKYKHINPCANIIGDLIPLKALESGVLLGLLCYWWKFWHILRVCYTVSRHHLSGSATLLTSWRNCHDIECKDPTTVERECQSCSNNYSPSAVLFQYQLLKCKHIHVMKSKQLEKTTREKILIKNSG